MKKRSKILFALLLVLVMVLSTACFDGKDALKQLVDGNDSSDVADNGDDLDDDLDDDFMDDFVDDFVDDSDDDAKIPSFTIAETVLYDADGIVVTAKGCGEDDWSDPEIKFLIENNTDKDVAVEFTSVSVNGYMMPYAVQYSEVTAGKKANEHLTIPSDSLKQSGIEVVAELQFCLEIQDPETFETIATSDPLTLTTSEAPYDQPTDDSGEVLYDDNGIKIVCKGLKQDDLWEGNLVFYMENNSGRAVSIRTEDVSVNGFMGDAGLWSELRAGTKLVDSIYLRDMSDLEISSIDQIENIEFRLNILDDEWNDIAKTDPITLNF